jgi:hypothetical protein
MASDVHILGLSLRLFTQIHVAISLIGIAAGLIAILGMIASKRLDSITAIFLVFTAFTSITGFFFPFHGVTPGIIVGVVSLVLLLPCILARYSFRLAGNWRWVYVVTAVIAEWFNVFVLIAQSFQKIPALHALAPTGTETPFKLAQLTALVLFLLLGIAAVRRFHPVTIRVA